MKRWWFVSGAIVAASVVLEIVFRHLAHPEYAWHEVPGFDFIYGLAGCLTIVIVSKWVGHRFLQRSEDYYRDAASEPSTSSKTHTETPG